MKTCNKNCDLQECLMCRGILPEWKPALDRHRKNYSIKKGESIIREGDTVNGIYFVYSGKLKIHKKWGNKELIVRFATQGAVIGHRGLSNNIETFPISATAIEPSVVCFVELDFFLATLRVNHEFAYRLLLFFADELQESERRMRDLALKSVKSRLAGALIQLSQLFGADENACINLDLSRNDLAAFTGATYETVFRTMNELVQDQLIALQEKKIQIINAYGLLALTKE
ncbi:Crp/Fnr family transcriptional regulator [Arcticibacter sp.]|uniref:Crp/Fnr family transcriptional regulator n=1 Tax=Arcticibacter sp. TaxID=1872630 RepID=UPI00388F6322